jgi:hypothetical protein
VIRHPARRAGLFPTAGGLRDNTDLLLELEPEQP